MRLKIAEVTKLGSVPAGAAIGLWMALVTEPWCTVHLDPRGGGTACLLRAGQPLTQPRFAWWLCQLAGAVVAGGLFVVSWVVRKPLSTHARTMVGRVLRVLAPVAGIGVGIGMAQFVSFCDLRLLGSVTATHTCSWQTTFPLWALIVFGAAAAAPLLLIAQAVEPHTPRSPHSALPYR
jgi:hypothetical protein